jgi:hypothetical protein
VDIFDSFQLVDLESDFVSEYFASLQIIRAQKALKLLFLLFATIFVKKLENPHFNNLGN